MSKITKHDSNGVKPLLDVGEFGYDNYPAGGDVGRVYIGTGTENIPVAKKAEVDLKADKSTTYTKTEMDAALALKVDDTEIASVNLLRADKYLDAQNIANMVYTDGNLTKIQYNNATDVDYEVFGYVSGKLSTIQHYVGSVLKGTTTLSYTGENLVSAIFVGV